MSRILIVEDEESIAELEKDYLELSGFDVNIQNNGKGGLEVGGKKYMLDFIKESPPDFRIRPYSTTAGPARRSGSIRERTGSSSC